MPQNKGNFMYEYNKKLTENSRQLRKNMTAEEKHLWYDFLKKLPFTVNRQKNIGNYILDFYIAKHKLAIEIDGSQHYSPENQAYDAQRDAFLKTYSITVLRYSNRDINTNFATVTKDILNHLQLTFEDLKK